MIPLPLFAPTDLGTVESNILPLVFAALLIDVLIVAVWYMIGVIMKNDAVKQSAKGEYYQFLGTALLTIILLWGLLTFATISYTALGATTLMSPTTMTNLCGSIESNTMFNILAGGANTPAYISGGSLLNGYTSASGKNVIGICNMLSASTLTDKVNYPLLATSVVIANLTNQTVNNLNSTQAIDSYIGFLSNLNPTLRLCFGPPEAIPCLIPGAPAPPTVSVAESYTPYAGLGMLYQGINVLGTLLTVSLESYIAQLLVITIILFAWPYLLFGGLVLRSTFLTRKIGGLLIAIALGSVIVFPTVFAIEYLTLGNGTPNLAVPTGVTAVSANTIYGFNGLSGIPQVTTALSVNALNPNAISANALNPAATGNYVVNFFVTPNIKQIAEANGCWPGRLWLAESADVLYLLNPGSQLLGILSQLITGALSRSPVFLLPFYCSPTGGVNTMMEMLNAYGVIGVGSYFLPIINLIITMSAITGMSGLMGGDVKLEGLSRFV